MARHPRNVAAHPYLLLPRLVVTLGSSIAAVSSRHQLPLDWQFAPHKQVFQLSLQTSLAYGRIPSGVGVIASIICALMIDKVGRKP